MSVRSIGAEFVALCNQMKNFDVMESMYDDNIVSVEADGKETAGKSTVIDKSRRWAAGIEIHGERVEGPFFHRDDQFAVVFEFDITPKSTGQRVRQREVGVYTVKGDMIVREVFYNSGVW